MTMNLILICFRYLRFFVYSNPAKKPHETASNINNYFLYLFIYKKKNKHCNKELFGLFLAYKYYKRSTCKKIKKLSGA